MTLLSTPFIAAAAARLLQAATGLAEIRPRRGGVMCADRTCVREVLTVPTSVAPAPVVIYRPPMAGRTPHVHVNFHGGGYVLRGMAFDDPLCRFLATEAGIVVVNVDYVVAPQHRFPAAVHQAFDVVSWVARQSRRHGWDGDHLTVGGQSAGGGLAAAVARQAMWAGGPSISLQVLHYPPLDLVTPARAKPSPISRPVITGWMGDVFDASYVPDVGQRSDPLASPAHPSDTEDLSSIAPAVVITCEYDRLRIDGERYANRLAQAGRLVEHHEVPGADHAYDMTDADRALDTYSLIARHISGGQAV